MIESIKIKGIATYDETGIEINNLKKVNFIYGVNGSGKTTATKLLFNPTEEQFKNCTVTWKHNLPLSTLVYNKDFREKNFNKGNIDGVFTLGEATKEDLETIEKKKLKLKEIRDDGGSKKATLIKQNDELTELENDFKEEVWKSIYKKHENNFKEVFRGSMQKESFKSRLIEEHENNESEILTYKQLKEKYETIFGKVPEEIIPFQLIDFVELSEIENDKIWSKKIVGKSDVDIAQLIQRLNINDWVNEGRKFIQEDDNTCPFCQSETITVNFKDQLEKYFDETFINDTASVKTNGETYNRLGTNILNALIQIETNEKANDSTKLNISSFSAHLKTFESQLISNRELINTKIKEPSRDIELILIQEQLKEIQTILENANKEIEIHNSIVANYNNEKDNLILCVWKYLVEKNSEEIKSFVKSKKGLNTGIGVLNAKITQLAADYRVLDTDIKNLSKNVTSVQPTVNEINRILKSYGFLNFEIVPSKTEANSYQIQREDETLAESTLSEGEITFITFLYFLQRAKGGLTEDKVNEERILVVDDPISSLDSNILFVVSSLLKDILYQIKKDIGNIKQIIVLTHNVYFHKEISFVDGREKNCPNTHFWILRKNKNLTSIQPFEIKNPIQTSYELMWQELKNKHLNSGITIQNTMRRIIENYYQILGKRRDSHIINKFPTFEDQQICRSLLCWINDGSHSINDDLFVEHQDNVIDKYFEVFRKIFEYTHHLEHYKMMMEEELTE